MNPRICEFCGTPAPASYQTCGNSHCQEAAYYRNTARNARGRKRETARCLAGEKIRIADEIEQKRRRRQ